MYYSERYQSNNRETEIEGIFACGNVVHVNDLVDNVSEESAVAGKYAAKYALGELDSKQKTVNCVTGTNVRYLCPQTIDANQKDGKVTLYFRVLQPQQKVTLVARCGDEVVAKKKRNSCKSG